MFCQKCGTESVARANYCSHCGFPVGLPPTVGKKLTRSSTDRKIAGVCGGFAEYLDLDSTLVRLLWIMMIFWAGWGAIGYLVAWIIMPEEPLALRDRSTASAATSQPATSS